jgi:hypothetical protein
MFLGPHFTWRPPDMTRESLLALRVLALAAGVRPNGATYEAAQQAFPSRSRGVAECRFHSLVLACGHWAPWANAGGEAYEDWYLVRDTASLDGLEEAAVTASRRRRTTSPRHSRRREPPASISSSAVRAPDGASARRNGSRSRRVSPTGSCSRPSSQRSAPLAARSGCGR